MKLFYFFFTMVFFFSFFATAKASGGPIDKKFESDLESKSPTLTPSKPVVLVVDDSASTRKYLKRFFKDNYEVVEAEDGDEALQACKERPFLFITMDWEMPGKTGPEAIRHIRTVLKLTTPIFAITSCTEPRHREELTHAGVQGIFSKPFRLEDLSQLNRVIEEHR